MQQARNGVDFGPPELARPLEVQERNKAVMVCAKYAQSPEELRTFVYMLGLVDEPV